MTTAAALVAPIDPSALIIAITTFLTGLYGIKKWKVASQRDRDQQAAANELQTRAQNHDMLRDVVTELRAEIVRKDAQIATLTTQITAERLEHRGEMSHLRDIVATLQSVATSELAKYLAEDGLGGLPPMLDQGPGRHGITDETGEQE